MTETNPPQETEAQARAALWEMITGYMVTQALHTAVELGIADLVASGPRTADDLAAATGTHPPSLTRLLRALAAFGVLSEDASGRVGPTPRSNLLRRDHPHSVGPTALFHAEAWVQEPWLHLTEAVRTGREAFEPVYGSNYWQYLADHPDDAAVFNEAQATAVPEARAAVAEAYDFAGVRTLVDVGGGYGQLLVAVLQAYPAIRGVLFDLPAVVAEAGPTLEAGGVADRCSVVGGDLFATVPPGGDAYMLSAVIHDWGDEESVAILSNCRRAMDGHGRLLLVERMAVPGAMPPSLARMDLHMLVLFGEARQRTEAEFRTLLDRSGLRMTHIVPTTADSSVIEAILA